MNKNYFSGRVVFDHLGKTGGMAITSMLRSSFGRGTVTPDGISDNHSVIIRKYGGVFPILCAHFNYNGEALDSRYTYFTVLRDPIDRALSFLFYLTNTIPKTAEIEGILLEAEKYLSSDGSYLGESLRKSLSNYYVNHFAMAYERYRDPCVDKLQSALLSIDNYDLIGFYDDIPGFMLNLSNLLGVRLPLSLPVINKTSFRPNVQDLSKKMLDNLREINQSDIEFFQIAKQRYASKILLNKTGLKSFERYDDHELPEYIFYPDGHISVLSPIYEVVIAKIFNLKVSALNTSSSSWIGSAKNPISFCYHWIDCDGKVVVFEGIRTPIDHNLIPAHQNVYIYAAILSPALPGRYRLVLTLVQEGVGWFDDMSSSFLPACLVVDVLD